MTKVFPGSLEWGSMAHALFWVRSKGSFKSRQVQMVQGPEFMVPACLRFSLDWSTFPGCGPTELPFFFLTSTQVIPYVPAMLCSSHGLFGQLLHC